MDKGGRKRHRFLPFHYHFMHTQSEANNDFPCIFHVFYGFLAEKDFFRYLCVCFSLFSGRNHP